MQTYYACQDFSSHQRFKHPSHNIENLQDMSNDWNLTHEVSTGRSLIVFSNTSI